MIRGIGRIASLACVMAITATAIASPANRNSVKQSEVGAAPVTSVTPIAIAPVQVFAFVADLHVVPAGHVALGAQSHVSIGSPVVVAEIARSLRFGPADSSAIGVSLRASPRATRSTGVMVAMQVLFPNARSAT